MIKNKINTSLCIALMIGGLHTASIGQELKTAEDSLAYSAGILFAKTLDDSKVKEVNVEVLAKAMEDYKKGNTTINADVAQTYYGNYINEIKAKEMNEAKEAGEKFLSANAKKEGVIVTESGLQYEVINEGSGPSPSATDKVLAHYHGTLIDGRVFDSSVERNEPITLPVNRVIQGWQEALQMMSKGSKWRLYIPFDLAYGAQGAGPLIAPYSALIFDVELLEIQ